MDKDTSVFEHLKELRKRLLLVFIPFLLFSCIAFPFVKVTLRFLQLPARGSIEKLSFFAPQEVAAVYVKVAVFCGFILSLPLIIYQAFKFISLALTYNQKMYAVSFILFTSIFFFLGAVFGYFFLIPASLKFLIGLAGDELVPVISISKYVSFVIALIIGCGITFLLPVLIWFLARLGAVSTKVLRKKRKYAFAVILVLAAIITPTTDPFNMFLLAVPMIALYEAGIWAAYFTMERKTRNKNN